MKKSAGKPFELAGTTILPGATAQIELPVSRLPEGTWLSLPVAIVNGAKPGKTLWLSGAIHGDELNGIEIIRELLGRLDPKRLSGTVIATPIVNVFGVVQGSRYLPDRRDLNRSFPGSSHGSLSSRLANLFMRKIIARCQIGIDFHTGTNFRSNLPQIRVSSENREAKRLANAFGAPVVFQAEDRKGSLRWAATRKGIAALLFEGGEAFRLDDHVIEAGVEGTLRVMRAAKMISKAPKSRGKPIICRESTWMRAKAGGVCRIQTKLGARVKKNQTVAIVSDAFNEGTNRVKSSVSGIVIGVSNNPLVNSGDALVHIAKVARTSTTTLRLV